jgi:hypothetical protein
MGLFDQVLGAMNNPALQGNSDQLGGLLGTVQQLAGSQGVDASGTQAILGALGGHVKSALQQQQASGGTGAVEALLNQFGGANPNPAAPQAVFGGSLGQVIQAVSQQTGINSGTIQAMLPALIPVVLGFLKTGAPQQNAAAGGNPVLNAFLDKDGDGDADLGDMMSLASQFLGR